MCIPVFISHSTVPKKGISEDICAKPAHAAFLKELCDHLRKEKNPKIEVLIDSDLSGGDPWRDTLFNCIEKCHAAIVLINKQALDNSTWVETEVNILAYRARVHKTNFRLILVPFGGVKEADIANKIAWDAVAIKEFQVEPRGGLNETDPCAVNELKQKIVTTLQNLPNQQEDLPMAWTARSLFVKLNAILLHGSGLIPHLNILRDITQTLNVPLDGVNCKSTFDIMYRLTYFLYENGPLMLPSLVQSHPIVSGNTNWKKLYREILEILSTYWVDVSASVGILSICHRDGNSHVIAINGKEIRHTPQTYVRQVCCSPFPWIVIAVDTTNGNDAMIDDICFSLLQIKAIRKSLRAHQTQEQGEKYLKVKKKYTKKAIKKTFTQEQVRQDLKEVMSDYTDPVFITFLQEGGGNVDDIINGIRPMFPKFHFILCTGTKSDENITVAPEIQMLFPLLDLKQETQEFKNYCAVIR